MASADSGREALCVCTQTFVVRGDEAQDVLVSEHDGLVNFGFAEPRSLVPGGEDLHGHVLSSPLSPPHLPEPALPDALLQDDGASDGPLHQQRQTCRTQKREFGTEVAFRRTFARTPPTSYQIQIQRCSYHQSGL